jgi:hypothetical protein
VSCIKEENKDVSVKKKIKIEEANGGSEAKTKMQIEENDYFL